MRRRTVGAVNATDDTDTENDTVQALDCIG
jgi:hypothetical protein